MIKSSSKILLVENMDIRDRKVFRLWEGATKK